MAGMDSISEEIDYANVRPVSVAVVIPAKNEADRIGATVRAALGLRGVKSVVVVDDGSTDATAVTAKNAGAVVVKHKVNRGKAAAMTTGARVVALREIREDHAPVEPPHALLFIDADLGDTAQAVTPLIDHVLDRGVDMAISLLPKQEGAGGRGIVVGTSRWGIEKATGWVATQPLSGTRCITRATWEACQPLAAGWGVETSLSIDALRAGFTVREVPCQLNHRPSGNDLRGQLHRAAQLRDVLRALATRLPASVLKDLPKRG